MSKKIIIWVGVGAVLSLGIWLIYLLFFSTSYSFVINSDADAQLLVATSKNDAFVEIGVGSAEYTTKQTEPIYVRATKDGALSMQTVFPVNSDGKVVELALYDAKKPSILLESPITSPLLENDVVYGVYEPTKSMSSIALKGTAPPKFSYVSIPYVDSVVWLDSNNYHYNIFGGGVGTVIDNSNEDLVPLEDLLIQFSETEAAQAVSRFASKPLVLLGYEALFVSNDFGKSLKQIASIKPNGNRFFETDSSYIYYGEGLLPSEYASEGEGESASLENMPSSKITVFDYSGNAVLQAKLAGTTSVASVGNLASSSSFLIATDEELLQLAPSGETIKTYDFPFPLDDIVVYEEAVYLFSSESIWRLDLSSETYNLVYDLGSSVYVDGSVEPTKTAGEFFFTTTIDAANFGTVYKLNLK